MTHTEWIIVGAAVVLWFAQGWYLNEALRGVHKNWMCLMSNSAGCGGIFMRSIHSLMMSVRLLNTFLMGHCSVARIIWT